MQVKISQNISLIYKDLADLRDLRALRIPAMLKNPRSADILFLRVIITIKKYRQNRIPT
jgi:hypothetical protein